MVNRSKPVIRFLFGIVASLLCVPSVSAESSGPVDLASCMPAETLVYAELLNPADHIQRLAEAMGLMEETVEANRNTATDEPVTIHLPNGLVLSSDFRLSPSLLAELKRVRGIAVGITRLSQRGEPVPLVIVDPGESSLLRGILETGIQVVPRADRLGGYPTYHHEKDFWCVQTPTCFLASPDKDALAACVKRMTETGSSLHDNPTFALRRRESQGALVFAYVDGANVREHVLPMLGPDAAAPRALLDLDHFVSATIMATATESGATVRARVSLDEDHNSLAYGMIRTVPFQREMFARIPGNAAAVAAIGINPTVEFKSEAQDRHLTALDIGREVFTNLADVVWFLLPAADEGKSPIPDFGLVLRANDAAKSEALWTQLLMLPSLMAKEHGPSSQKISIEDHDGRRYTFPGSDVPTLDLVRLDDHSMVFGTPLAVREVIQVPNREHSILGDADLAKAIQRAPAHASKAVFVHLGRMAEVAARMHKGHDAQHLAMLSQVLSHLKLAAISDEAPSELTVAVEASELPVLGDVIRTVAMLQQQGNHGTVAVHDQHHRESPARPK